MGKARGGVVTTGTGSVTAIPDLVVVELGAEVAARGVQEALDGANAALGAARDSLFAAGIAAGDVRTAQTSTWTDAEQHRTTARLTLRATLRDVAGSGAVVRAALAAAGDAARLDSMSFAIADPAPLVAAAREAAWAQARACAEQYAALAGRSLGPVVEIVEDGGGSPMLLRAAKASFESADEFAVEPGTQEVRARVTVRWGFADD